MTEGQISRLPYTLYNERLTLLSIHTADNKLFQPIDSLNEYIQAIEGAKQRGDTRAEAKHVKKALACAKRALERYEELGQEEPQLLVELFNTLVQHRNDLEPGQSQGRSR